jgi:RHS repeat-associated protein
MPGQYFDTETGLFYNWNRYYSPAIGRYISSDPIGLEGGMNTFNYALQSPVMYTDPEGLDAGVLTGTAIVTVVIGGTAVSIELYKCTSDPVCNRALADQMANAGNKITYETCKLMGYSDATCQSFASTVCSAANANEGGADGPASNTISASTPDPDDCNEEWRIARQRCSDILSLPANERPQGIWGGSYDKCVKGQVSQLCGGNRVN